MSEIKTTNISLTVQSVAQVSQELKEAPRGWDQQQGLLSNWYPNWLSSNPCNVLDRRPVTSLYTGSNRLVGLKQRDKLLKRRTTSTIEEVELVLGQGCLDVAMKSSCEKLSSVALQETAKEIAVRKGFLPGPPRETSSEQLVVESLTHHTARCSKSASARRPAMNWQVTVPGGKEQQSCGVISSTPKKAAHLLKMESLNLQYSLASHDIPCVGNEPEYKELNLPRLKLKNCFSQKFQQTERKPHIAGGEDGGHRQARESTWGSSAKLGPAKGENDLEREREKVCIQHTSLHTLSHGLIKDIANSGCKDRAVQHKGSTRSLKHRHSNLADAVSQRPYTKGCRLPLESRKKKARSPYMRRLTYQTKKKNNLKALHKLGHCRSHVPACVLNSGEKEIVKNGSHSILECVKGNIREDVYMAYRGDPPNLTKVRPQLPKSLCIRSGHYNLNADSTFPDSPHSCLTTARSQMEAVNIVYGAKRRAHVWSPWIDSIMSLDNKITVPGEAFSKTVPKLEKGLLTDSHPSSINCPARRHPKVLQDGSWKEMNEAEVIILDGARLVKQKRARWKKENDAITITRRAMGLEANSKNKSLMNSGLAALIQGEELKLQMQRSLTQKPSKLNSRESLCSTVSLPWHTSAQLAGHGLNPKMTSNIQVGVDQTTTRNVSEKLIEAWVTGRFGSDFKKALRQADKILSEKVVHQGQKEISDWLSPSRALKGRSSFKESELVSLSSANAPGKRLCHRSTMKARWNTSKDDAQESLHTEYKSKRGTQLSLASFIKTIQIPEQSIRNNNASNSRRKKSMIFSKETWLPPENSEGVLKAQLLAQSNDKLLAITASEEIGLQKSPIQLMRSLPRRRRVSDNAGFASLITNQELQKKKKHYGTQIFDSPAMCIAQGAANSQSNALCQEDNTQSSKERDCSLLKNSIQGLPVTMKLASFSPRTLGDMAVEAHDHLLDISPWVSGSLAEDGPHGRDSYGFCTLQKWPSQPIYRELIHTQGSCQTSYCPPVKYETLHKKTANDKCLKQSWIHWPKRCRSSSPNESLPSIMSTSSTAPGIIKPRISTSVPVTTNVAPQNVGSRTQSASSGRVVWAISNCSTHLHQRTSGASQACAANNKNMTRSKSALGRELVAGPS